MTQQEVQTIMTGPDLVSGRAGSPLPADRATDVPRDTTLAWTAGTYAATHDVYFGTALRGCQQRQPDRPKGVLVSQGQTGATFDAGRPARLRPDLLLADR